MTDETIRFDPPITLHELVAQAGEEEWAIAATTMVARMLREVAHRGAVPLQWLASLKVFGLAEELPICPEIRGRVPCRLTPAGEKAARSIMVIT